MNVFSKNIFLLIFLTTSFNVFCQKSTGDKHFDKLEYADAIPYYQKDYSKTNNRESLTRLAFCNYITKHYSAALENYKELEKTGTLNSDELFAIAKLYFQNDNPELGKEYMQKYAATSGSKWWADSYLDSTIITKEDNVYLIQPLKFLNTSYSEFCPQIYRGELIFTSDRPSSVIPHQEYGGTHTPFLNIFTTDHFALNDSLFKVKTWYFNSDYSAHNGPAYFDSVSNVLFFTHVNDVDKGKINKASILYSQRDGKHWKHPERLNSSKEFSVGHPAFINADILIVSSDQPGGKGGKDLYFLKRNGTEIDLYPVPGINTPGDEVFPSIRKMTDGTSRLYFSSDGYLGKGGLDLYSIEFTSSTEVDTHILWHKELSSSHDDFGIYFENESQGYFSSDRTGGKGGDDLYFFIENPNAVVICLTSDNGDIELAGKKVAVKNNNDILETHTIDENGCLKLKKLPDGANALQLLDNTSENLKIRSVFSGVKNENKLVVLDQNGTTLIELINKDGNHVIQKVRTVWLTDRISGKPAKGIRIEVLSMESQISEIILTDEEGKAILKKIPSGEKFLLKLDVDEAYLDPKLRTNDNTGILLTDADGKLLDSIGAYETEIKIEVVKVSSLDLCFYNQLTGEPLAHYHITLRAEDGTPLDTVVTDANGCYKFKSLPQGELLLTIENYEGGALKTKISGDTEKNIPNITVKNSNGDVIENIQSAQGISSRTFCIFDKATGKPVTGSLIHLANEQFIIIDSVRTGTDGCFTYKKLSDAGSKLQLLIVADEAELFVRGKENSPTEKMEFSVYSNNLLLDSVSSSSSDYSLGILQRMIVSGCLTNKTDGKPLAFTKVYFRDEKGQKIDSTTTDKNGCFDYKKLGSPAAQMQVMNNGDIPFQFTLQDNSSIPNRLVVRDQYENLLNTIDPVLKRNATPSSTITFYDQYDNHPVSGMEIKVISDGKELFYVTNEKGQFSYEFKSGKNYKIEVPSEKLIVNNSISTEGFQIEWQSEKNSFKVNAKPGEELFVKIANADYVTANFKNENGQPVENLPVEWYDERTGKWNLSLTEENGNSRHIYNKKPDEVKIRVNGNEIQNIQSNNNDEVKIYDNNGKLIGTAPLSKNRTFSLTVKPNAQNSSEINISGIVSSSGNPVNGTTIYIKTPEGVLIQKTSTDYQGKYFFKKLPQSTMMLEIDTSDLKMKYRANVEINGAMTNATDGSNLIGAEIIAGDGTGLKLELCKTDDQGQFNFKIDIDKLQASIENSKNNPWNSIVEGVTKEIVLNSIYFDYDKWNITFESERELDKALKFLKENPTASLNIKAHTDSRGADEYNLILSRKRAKSVMRYFYNHDIDTLRLMSFGYGESQLINNCTNNTTCSDAMHKKNRRIEFEVSWNGTSHNTRTVSPLITEVKTNDQTNTTNQSNSTNQTHSTSTETGRWYKIQITTSSKLINTNKDNFKGLENVEYYIDNGIYKYTIGKFATKEEAILYRKNVIDLYPQAFPIVLENGQRVK